VTSATDTYRTKPGAVFHDWRRGDRVVVSILRSEDLGRFTDGVWWKGSSAERCALHGGHPRREMSVRGVPNG
jgi:hypothetical protein